MTTGPGRNRRRRGRRGQRQNQDEQRTPQPQTTQGPANPVVEQPTREAESGRDRDQARAGDRQGQGGGRKRNRSRRRSNRRQDVGPMPTEVLKDQVRHLHPTGTIASRTLDDAATADGLTFGCPMLTRTGLGMPFAQGQRAPRCAMGWALHDEDEAALCMRTPNMLQCWKDDPEREAELRSDTGQDNAAD